MKRSRVFLLLLIGCSLLLALNLLFGPGEGIAGTRRGLKYQFTMTSPVNSGNLSFEDEFVNVVFNVDRKKIAFSLTNRSGNPIKINWGDVAFIDSTGQSHKCLHQESTAIVPPTATIKDSIVPVDYVYSQNIGRLGTQQKEIEFLPRAGKKQAKAYEGKSFSVFMPVEENGVIKNYLFSFRIDIVED